MIVNQLRSQLPDDIKNMTELVNISRILNNLTGSTQYTPSLIREMPIDDLDQLLTVTKWQMY